MTNAEKFKEVFGLQPDTRFCPFITEHDCDECKYLTQSCIDGDVKGFWSAEYKGVSTVDAIPVEKLRLAMERIKYKSTTETKCEGMGMPFVRVKMIETNLALDILQDLIGECDENKLEELEGKRQ